MLTKSNKTTLSGSFMLFCHVGVPTGIVSVSPCGDPLIPRAARDRPAGVLRTPPIGRSAGRTEGFCCTRRKAKQKNHPCGWFCLFGVPTGIRTPVTAVKGRCPRPLDDGDPRCCSKSDVSCGGGKRDRTADLLHAMQALSQLSYTPTEERALYVAPLPL